MLGVLLAAALGASATAGAKAEVYCPLSARQATDSGVDPGSVKPVSRSDYMSKVDQRFSKYDKNRDGKLLQDELPANRARKAMKRFDGNGDGKIEMAEWSKGMLARFDKRDVDSDGVMATEERGARYSAAPIETTNDDGDE